MRRFVKDTRGSAVIWTLFLILIFFTLTFIVYTGVTVYAKYQTCETELERAVIITVDTGLLNANVRDLELDIPAVSAHSLLEDNLVESGWTKEDGNWVKRDVGKLIYALEDMQMKVAEKTMRIDALFTMPMPWQIDGIDKIHIPIKVLSSVLYIE